VSVRQMMEGIVLACEGAIESVFEDAR